MTFALQKPFSQTTQRSGNTAKVVLISLAVAFGLMFLVCAGLLITAYWWLQRNFGEAYVTEPAAIHKILTELTDVSIPPEFTPYSASRLFGLPEATYRWCPEGNCPPALSWDEEEEDQNLLSGIGLLVFASEPRAPAQPGNPDPTASLDADYTDKALEGLYASYTKERHEVTIRGRVCHFWVLKYVSYSLDDEDSVFPDMETHPEAPADATQPANLASEGERMVLVDGTFPGKSGEIRLT